MSVEDKVRAHVKQKLGVIVEEEKQDAEGPIQK